MTTHATPEEHRRALFQGTEMLIQLKWEIDREKRKRGKKDKGEDPDLPMPPRAPEGVT